MSTRSQACCRRARVRTFPSWEATRATKTEETTRRSLLRRAARNGALRRRRREHKLDAGPEDQELALQPFRIVQRLRHDDGAVDDAGPHVGEIIEVDRLARRIH